MYYKKFVCNPTRENLMSYRKILLIVRKEINKRKRINFKSFVSNLNLTSGSVKFWNTI